MSILSLHSAEPTSYRPVPSKNPDVEFQRRWTAWKARGLAHERTIRRRFFIVAIVTSVIAGAALVVYSLLSA